MERGTNRESEMERDTNIERARERWRETRIERARERDGERHE